jgi:hypothetical protein
MGFVVSKQSQRQDRRRGRETPLKVIRESDVTSIVPMREDVTRFRGGGSV